MDYSLLIGIKRKTFFVNDGPNPDMVSSFSSPLTSVKSVAELSAIANNNSSNNNNGTGGSKNTTGTTNGVDISHQNSTEFAIPAAAVEGAGSFYFGIIDTLQDWNWTKWNERTFKMLVLGKDGEGLSAIEPKAYRDRFMKRAVLDIFPDIDYHPTCLNDHDLLKTPPTTPKDSMASKHISISSKGQQSLSSKGGQSLSSKGQPSLVSPKDSEAAVDPNKNTDSIV